MAGVALAVALSIGLGVAVVATVGRLPLQLQATLEGLAAVLAVIVVTWMLFWMRRQGRAIKGELESTVSAALAAGATSALVGIAFLAVIREGLETTLFFLAVLASQSGDVTSAVAGGLVGLGIAVAIGWAIFAMGVRVNLGRFFTVTGVIAHLRGRGTRRVRRGRVHRGWLPAAPATVVRSRPDAAADLTAGLGAQRHVRVPLGAIRAPGRGVAPVPDPGPLPLPQRLAPQLPPPPHARERLNFAPPAAACP